MASPYEKLINELKDTENFIKEVLFLNDHKCTTINAIEKVIKRINISDKANVIISAS